VYFGGSEGHYVLMLRSLGRSIQLFASFEAHRDLALAA